MFVKKESALRISITALIATMTFSAVPVTAQQLEEIIVTAQRREQSLQEVPVSIQTFGGPELIKMGYRTMEDLTAFAPSVEMNESLHEHSVTIRGMGNDVANISVEQSAPVFVDGVHFGRPSMIKGAFLDLERVEILTGPQPVFFGQNAVAGAFSLTTKKPSMDAWDGDLSAEYGVNHRQTIEGGVGGPVSDTLGVRVAGQWDSTDGHLTDLFTGNSFPHRTDEAARLTLLWQPMEQLSITAKAEAVKRNSDGDTTAVCNIEGPDADYNSTDAGAVLERGLVPEYDRMFQQRPFPNCEDGFKAVGVQEGTGYYLAPVQGINNDDGRSGAIDIRELAKTVFPDGNLTSREPMAAWNFRLGADYELANGIKVEGIAAAVDYNRDTFESSDESPFLMEAAFRTEQFNMKSGELRFSSPTGGQYEWSTGVYWQKEDLQMTPVITMRGNLAQPIRKHDPYSNADWKSAFGTFTFNFLDEKASIDVGGRYQDVKKDGGITLQTATYIFDINPDPDGDMKVDFTTHRPAVAGGDFTSTGSNIYPGTITAALPAGSNQALAEAIISCETGLDVAGAEPDRGAFGARLGAALCGPYFGKKGYWTHEFGESDIPNAWDTKAPIAMSAFRDDMSTDVGPFLDTYNEDSFDPQITLRYRPTPDHSVYAKWARAFKAGGFDTSDRGIPRGGLRYNERAGVTGVGYPITAAQKDSFGPNGLKEFTYLAEHAENWELGARGNLFDGAARYGVTLFWTEIADLQLETAVGDITTLQAGLASTGRYMTNAGKQRTRGLEFDGAWAATDNLTVNAGGVIQQGIMVSYIGGCTITETLNQSIGPCSDGIRNTEVNGISVVLPAGSIDRSGAKAPRTPDWRFILGADYQHSLFENYKYSLNTKAAISDHYTEDTMGFTYVQEWPIHTDLSLHASIGDAQDTWDIGLYGRNLLGAKQVYRPEYYVETDGRGLLESDMPEDAFFTYGIQFNYHFR